MTRAFFSISVPFALFLTISFLYTILWPLSLRHSTQRHTRFPTILHEIPNCNYSRIRGMYKHAHVNYPRSLNLLFCHGFFAIIKVRFFFSLYKKNYDTGYILSYVTNRIYVPLFYTWRYGFSSDEDVVNLCVAQL